MGRSESHQAAQTWVGMLLLFGWVSPVSAVLDIPDGWTPATAKLVVTDRLATEDKELVVETDEWKVIFSLFYNGGIYRLFDKVHDSNQQDNLVTGPGYWQGGLFDYDVYLEGDQEFSTAIGKNAGPGRASLTALENTPVGCKYYPAVNRCPAWTCAAAGRRALLIIRQFISLWEL